MGQICQVGETVFFPALSRQSQNFRAQRPLILDFPVAPDPGFCRDPVFLLRGTIAHHGCFALFLIFQVLNR